jgi:hypothetical protein
MLAVWILKQSTFHTKTAGGAKIPALSQFSVSETAPNGGNLRQLTHITALTAAFIRWMNGL